MKMQGNACHLAGLLGTSFKPVVYRIDAVNFPDPCTLQIGNQNSDIALGCVLVNVTDRFCRWLRKSR
jgi:hypothetical protein